jgi:transposase
MKTYNYTNKVVYVGIDVHKKTYSCVSICEKEVVKRDSMPAKPQLLLSYLKNTFASATSIKTAYEAGFSGFWLHRYLIEQGIDNIVVHPGSIEISSRNRVKTDKRDALKIATQLSAGRLRGVFVPSCRQEERRSVTRLRLNMVTLKHQIGAELKALLFTQNWIDKDDDTVLSQKWLSKKLSDIESSHHSHYFKYSVNQYAQQWQQLNTRIKEINTMLKQQSQEDIGLQQIYESAPGIGLLSGRILANELGDMKQFHNEKQLFSFTGLTPAEHSSGEHTHLGHITRQGNPILRGILVEAAWKAILEDDNLGQIFQRLAKKSGKKRAIVGIARRLIGRLRSCIITGSLYQLTSKQQIDFSQKMVA